MLCDKALTRLSYCGVSQPDFYCSTSCRSECVVAASCNALEATFEAQETDPGLEQCFSQCRDTDDGGTTTGGTTTGGTTTGGTTTGGGGIEHLECLAYANTYCDCLGAAATEDCELGRAAACDSAFEYCSEYFVCATNAECGAQCPDCT